MAIAPNTGTSQLVNSSASILPVYSKFFIEKNRLMAVPFAAKYLSNETFWLYQEAVNLNPEFIIDVCQNVQAWVDQGISMELVLNPNLYNSAATLRDWYLKALIGDGYKRSKTVYYLRPLQADKAECSSCAN
jgi:ribonucleoside-diphosphate reductase alpha chain